VRNIFITGYYRLHIILFVPNLIIPLPINVLPTIETSLTFLHISVGSETPNWGQVK